MSKYELKQSIILELEIDTLREQVKNLKKENTELKWELNQLKSDQEKKLGKTESQDISHYIKTDIQ